MTGTHSHSGEGIGDKIRKGVGLVHGTGETIRGNFNATVDSAAGDRSSAARHETVAERGLDEMHHGHYHGTGAGVTPVGTTKERQNRALQGEYAPQAGSINHGPHATTMGNKADPRVDSDLDHRGIGHGVGARTGTTGTSGLETGVTHGSTNHGPHSTNVANKADPRVDSDLDHRGTVQTSTTFGPHSSNMANKVDPTVDSDLDRHYGMAGGPKTTTGPHGTDFANNLDPRVDSNAGQFGTGVTHGTTTTTEPHTSNLSNKLTGTQASTTTAAPPSNFATKLEHGGASNVGHHSGTVHDSSNHGPHSSNLANKLDPRVDSDLDHRGTGASTGTSTGTTHTSTTHGLHDTNVGKVDSLVDAGMDNRSTGVGTSTGTTHTSTNHGPHTTNIANKADPRIDSDLDHRGATHGTTHVDNKVNPRVDEVMDHHHGTGTGKHSTNYGPHDTNVANKADPRVDSDLDHRGATHGSANNGPHSSKIANKLDPRVDSKTGTWK